MNNIVGLDGAMHIETTIYLLMQVTQPAPPHALK